MLTVKLQSADGKVFTVDYENIKASETIKTMVENLGLMENDEEIVPLPKVHSSILEMIIQWATHHKDDLLPVENDEKRTDDISDWDKKFMKVDQSKLYELITAANYLDIRGLVDLTCKTVANMIKGKNPEEIRKTFNIKNDFTPEEEEEIAQQNQWLEGPLQ